MKDPHKFIEKHTHDFRSNIDTSPWKAVPMAYAVELADEIVRLRKVLVEISELGETINENI